MSEEVRKLSKADSGAGFESGDQVKVLGLRGTWEVLCVYLNDKGRVDSVSVVRTGTAKRSMRLIKPDGLVITKKGKKA